MWIHSSVLLFINFTAVLSQSGKLGNVLPVSATGQAYVLLRGSQCCYYSTYIIHHHAMDEDAEINWTLILFLPLVLIGSLPHPRAQVLCSLSLSLTEASARCSAVFLVGFFFSFSAPFLALLVCSVFFLFCCDFLSLSLLFISYLPKKKMEIENGADTVVLDYFSSSAILAVQFSGCQGVECRVARRSSWAARLENAPSEPQQQFGNESRLTLLLIQQGNVVGLFQ